MNLPTSQPTAERKNSDGATFLTRMLFQGAGRGHQCSKSDQVISPGEGEVLVRLTLATICGSDLHTYQGRRACHTPSVLGHEGVGIVDAVGEGQDKSLVGKRITWTLTDTCGCCKPCTDWNIPQKCESLFKYGHAALDAGSGLNGCFSSHIMLRKGTSIVPLSDDLTDIQAVPANCALSTMVAVVEPILNHTIRPQKILIQGAGLLGIYGAALLRHSGIAEVHITDIDQDRLSFAKKFGAHPVLASDLNQSDPDQFDAIIEVAGVSHIISEGIRLLRPGGMYVWAGMVHDRTPLDILGVDVVKGCTTIIGVHNYRAEHLEKGIHFLTETTIEYPWNELVAPPMKLSEIDAAFTLSQQQKWHRVSLTPDF